MSTVILDLDGPVLDGQQRHYECYREIVIGCGHRPMELEAYWEMKRERKGNLDQLSATHAESIINEFGAKWLSLIETPKFLALDRLHPWVPDVLRQWKRDGRRLVLATHRRDGVALLRQLSEFGLKQLFDEVVRCDPSVGFLSKAKSVQENVGFCTDDEFVWIGDTEADIDAARQFGCTIWAVCCGLRTREFLSMCSPDHICSDLREVRFARS